jgi:hypothetical protein
MQIIGSCCPFFHTAVAEGMVKLNVPTRNPLFLHLEVSKGGTMKRLATVKLLPLPQPPVRARTEARTNPSAQRATQLRCVLARVYAVSIQNQITTTVP